MQQSLELALEKHDTNTPLHEPRRIRSFWCLSCHCCLGLALMRTFRAEGPREIRIQRPTERAQRSERLRHLSLNLDKLREFIHCYRDSSREQLIVQGLLLAKVLPGSLLPFVRPKAILFSSRKQPRS